jgi:hypothetical protein
VVFWRKAVRPLEGRLLLGGDLQHLLANWKPAGTTATGGVGKVDGEPPRDAANVVLCKRPSASTARALQRQWSESKYVPADPPARWSESGPSGRAARRRTRSSCPCYRDARPRSSGRRLRSGSGALGEHSGSVGRGRLAGAAHRGPSSASHQHAGRRSSRAFSGSLLAGLQDKRVRASM